MNDELLINCSCSSLGHVARFSNWPEDGCDNQATIEIALDLRTSFWMRLKTAWLYLFNRPCAYGVSAEFMLRREDVPRVRAWLDRFEPSA